MYSRYVQLSVLYAQKFYLSVSANATLSPKHYSSYTRAEENYEAGREVEAPVSSCAKWRWAAHNCGGITLALVIVVIASGSQ